MSIETIWVTAQYVNNPDPVKNPRNPNGSIKDPVLGYISVPPQALPQFQKGKRYCIQIETTDKGYKNFRGFANPAPTAPQSTAGNFTGAPQQIARPVAPTAPQRQRLTAPPQTFAQQFDAQALNIFTTGITGRALGSGHFTAADIDELVREAKAAFMKHLSGIPEIVPAPHQTSAPEPEYNDPLPDPSQYGAQPPVDDWQQ